MPRHREVSNKCATYPPIGPSQERTTLNLTRRPGESVEIFTPDGVVTVTVNRVKGCRVGVEVTAPRQIQIERSERLQEGNAA